MDDTQQKKIFAQNLRYYLDLNNKSQKEVADAIQVSPQTFNTWTQGIAIPRMGKVQLLADYFHIKKTDLIDKHNEITSDEQPTYYITPETAEMAQAIFENKELRILFDAAKDAAPEDLQALQSMLIALKRKERGGDDG